MFWEKHGRKWEKSEKKLSQTDINHSNNNNSNKKYTKYSVFNFTSDRNDCQNALTYINRICDLSSLISRRYVVYIHDNIYIYLQKQQNHVIEPPTNRHYLKKSLKPTYVKDKCTIHMAYTILYTTVYVIDIKTTLMYMGYTYLDAQAFYFLSFFLLSQWPMNA